MRRLVIAVIALAIPLEGTVLAARPATPVPVSPGDAEELLAIEQVCPTFSWAGPDTSGEYELAVFRVGADETGGETTEEMIDPVVRVSLPGSATSWTPSRDHCLRAGERYAWAVRTVEAGQPTDWSTVQLFEVDPLLERQELEKTVKKEVRKALEEGVLDRIPGLDPGRLDALAGERSPGDRVKGARSQKAAPVVHEPQVEERLQRSRIVVEDDRLEPMSARKGELADAIGPDAALGNDLRLRDGADVEKVLLDSTDGAATGADLVLSRNDGSLSFEVDSQDGTDGWSLLKMWAADMDGVGRVQTIALSPDDASGNSAAISLTGQKTDGSLATETILLTAAEGDDNGAQIELSRIDGLATVEIDGEFGSSGDGNIKLFADDPDTPGARIETVEIESTEGGSDGGQIALRNRDGVATIVIDSEHGLGGPGRIISQEVQITGGADLSEQFAIRSGNDDTVPEPGMVVAIADDGSGELEVADGAYDRGVVGVISGAGGLQTGLYMGQDGSSADGKHPVALTGRVYALADASHGAIRPGDFLSSSETPGHAMRVDDPVRARGAILGKALTGLDEGRGLVMLLVTLQ